MANEMIDAMKIFQKGMVGEAERTGLDIEEAINDLIFEVRKEIEKEYICK